MKYRHILRPKTQLLVLGLHLFINCGVSVNESPATLESRAHCGGGRGCRSARPF